MNVLKYIYIKKKKKKKKKAITPLRTKQYNVNPSGLNQQTQLMELQQLSLDIK